jgi:hypothetical protein
MSIPPNIFSFIIPKPYPAVKRAGKLGFVDIPGRGSYNYYTILLKEKERPEQKL